MNRVLLIGNSGHDGQIIDGQTVKVLVYLKKIKEEGFTIKFVDLFKFLRHPFSTLAIIKKGIKECDRIVLVTAERGSKILIPYINFVNKKYHKPFIFPLIGTSVLHYSIDRLNDEQKNDFIINHNFSYCRPKRKLVNQLKQITYILPETEQLCDVFSRFYNLHNVRCLNNFREIERTNLNDVVSTDEIKLVFLSRVMNEKGILDLVRVVNRINEKSKVTLDIYGKLLLSEDDRSIFNELIKNDAIKYCGEVDNSKVISTLRNYDLLVFPTKFVGEGTPGVIVESLLAGTPVLTSDFPQAKFLLKNGEDSLCFNMFDNEDLYNKLVKIIENKNILISMRRAAKESGKKYTYEHERAKFLKYICGAEEE